MCYQLVEVYTACRCLYYRHAVDKCALSTYPNHNITERVIDVGYACAQHTPCAPNTSTSDWDSDWDSDSATIISQSSTTVSTASSTTAVEEDAMETLFRHMLYFQDLRYLWPQLITLHNSQRQCLRTISDFLKRYADDLGRLAAKKSPRDHESSIRRTACRFVRRKRHNLAQRLWEAHTHSLEIIDDDEEFLPGQDVLEPLENKPEDDDDDSKPIDSVAERFLFDTEPIQALESSVKAFVETNTSDGNGHTHLLGGTVLQTYLMNLTTRFAGPIKQGSHRISWECVSASRLHSGFF